MAIQQLTQPILNPIAAFDGMTSQTISFIVIGGAQVIGNRLIISDNQTGRQIYNNTQSTMKLEHTIPAGTLSNGRYYNAVIYTIDSSGTQSMASVAVPFYCYSQPTLTIDNIPSSETIENGTYQFTGSYLQSEGEALNSYQFTLYDSNKNILSQTPLIYYETDDSLSYTFVGMSNDTSYYVSLTGETVNNTKITSGLKYFTVRYLQPASFAICDLVNDCDNGFIQISSNIVAIDGKSNPEPPIYIDDKEVDLRDPDSWVRWGEGFSIKNDFTMRVWGRDFNPYENIITLSNNLNSTGNPNKIEMKWMIGETIKNLPQYKNAEGKNVNLKDSKTGGLKNLMVGGSTVQETREEIYYGKDTSITIVDEEKVSADGKTKRIPHEEVIITNIYGNQYQLTQEESSQEIEGENIHLEDVDSSKPADLFIKGNHYQDSREGYNLLNLEDVETTTENGITFSIKKGIIQSINGTPKSTSYLYLYTFNNEITLKAGTYTLFLSSPITNAYVVLLDKSSTWIGQNVKSGQNSVTFTLMSDTNVKYVACGDLNTSKTVSGKNVGVMLVSGSTIPTKFEQYGVSPSPDYPSSIKTVGSNVNLFDESKAITSTKNGMTLSYSEKGLVLNGTTTALTNFWINDLEIDLESDNYTLSSNVSLKDKGMYVLNDENGKYIFQGDFNSAQTVKLTSKKCAKYFLIQIAEGVTFNNQRLKIKLEKGTVATPYSPYNQGSVEIKISNNDNSQSQSVIMPIQQEMLEGDYIKDVEHHEWGKLIFDENSDIECTHAKESTFQFRFMKQVDGNALSKVICNMSSYWRNLWGENGCFVSYNGYFCILCKENEFGFNADMTTDEAITHFKTILANSKLIVYYKLATPVSLALTSSQQTAQSQLTNMTLYQNITNISNEGSYPAIMNLNYNIVRKMPSPDYPSEIETVGSNVNELKLKNGKSIKAYGLDVSIDNGIITINGTASGYYPTFLISGDGEIETREGAPSINANPNWYNSIALAKRDYTLKFEYISGDGGTAHRPYVFIHTSDGKNSEFSQGNSTKIKNYTGEIAGISFYVEENQTFNNYKFRVYVVKDTYTKDTIPPYSPYGMGSVEIDIVNKNLLDKNLIERNASCTYGNIGLVPRVEINVKNRGTLTPQNAIKIKPNTTYVLTVPNGIRFAVAQLESDLKSLGDTGWLLSTASPYTLTTQHNAKYIGINFGKDDNSYFTDSEWDSFLNGHLQLEVGDTATDFVEHQSQSVIMPIQQEMLKGDYIKDVEHHEWGKIVLTGNENWMKSGVTTDDVFVITMDVTDLGAVSDSKNILCNRFVGDSKIKDGNIFIYNYGKNLRLCFDASKINTIEQAKNYLKENYNYCYYKLKKPVDLELTSEQKAAKNMLYNWKTYIPITHINTDSDFPILESFTPKIPSLFNESVLYSLGQHKNLINIPNFVINYSQGYGTATKTDLVLRKNSTYTLSFEYNITNETTDAYYSIGYGVDAYEHDLNANIIYTNSTTGKNVFTLTTPENLPENNFLWIKFGHTIILADLTVEIMNIQLEYGEKETDYQSPNLYNIYPAISNKNLYDFRNYVYTIKNNAVVQVTNNGYNIQVKTIGEESSLAVGFMNILNPGETYAISFQTLGGFSGYKLYTTEKNSQIPLSEIIINDGIFVAPEGVYDLQLVFLINSDGTNNSTDIWNIQIEQNNQVTEYETHESNKSQVVIGEPLRGIEEYRDLIFSTSPNILNPQTKSAAVEGNKDYYLNQRGNTLYYVWYYNKEGNLITFIDEEGKEASGAILTRGIFTTHEDCVRIIINKSANPQTDDLSGEEILNNNVMISEYSSFSAYYPYLQEPSEIRYIKKIELTGDEDLILATGQRFRISLQDNNYPAALDTDDEINAVSNYLTGVNSSVDNVDYSVSANGNSLYLKFTDNSSGNDVRTEIKSRYDKGEPIQIFYKMKNSVINSLSSDNNESLQKLVTYEPISNVFTDNSVLGMLNFSYINSMTEQQTENAYVQLKCYNMNKLPYYVHSNYIDIPDDTDKVFIWVRRKNNLFDLKIENLGDYSGDKPGDKNKPIVSLDIDLTKVTSTQIPVIANAVDETGLKTIRFSKDNGETWEEVIAIDGLSTTKSYVFENLIPETTYTIRVEAIDVSGNIGGISQNVTTKAT